MKLLTLFLPLIIIAACFPMPPDTAVTSPPIDDISTNKPLIDPILPGPDDSKSMRGSVFISESDLVIRESYPPQISLHLSGALPTPCHKLRVKIDPPETDNRINIEVYSIVNSDRTCIQVLQPFQENIDLGTYPAGHYTVWLNGEVVAEFDS